jgi:translation elongation factor EF-1beta
MEFFNKRAVKRYSIATLLMFIFSIFGGYVPTASAAEVTIQVDGAASLEALGTVIPQVSNLQSKIQSAQSTVKSLEAVCTPIHDAVLPTNMEAMSIAERMKAIISNAKSVLGNTLESSTASAKAKVAQGVSLSSLSREEQIAFGVEQLGAQAAKLETNGTTSGMVLKVKEVLQNVKEVLNRVVTAVRGKIFEVGQKAGLIDESKIFEDGKVIDKSESKYGAKKQMSDENSGVAASGKAVEKPSFAGKLSKGVSDGVDAAKTSLKSSFSFSSLLTTTTVAVGTNLAIDVINGNKPSLKKAVKSVASLEFAGSVVGSALGAAGGQFAGTLVKTFVPGIVGNLIGSVIPVMFSSASGQLSANLITGIKNGEFSVAKAFSQIDKVDLIGSSIGSTIGMTLGSVVPVVGPIIGGIVGGFLGSKIAKWITGGSSSQVSSGKGINAIGNTMVVPAGGISIGGSANVGGGDTGIVAAGGAAGISQNLNVSQQATGDFEALETARSNYYNAYLEYNRLIQANDIDGAKIMFKQLKVYSDEYSNLKNNLGK